MWIDKYITKEYEGVEFLRIWNDTIIEHTLTPEAFATLYIYGGRVFFNEE